MWIDHPTSPVDPAPDPTADGLGHPGGLVEPSGEGLFVYEPAIEEGAAESDILLAAGGSLRDPEVVRLTRR